MKNFFCLASIIIICTSCANTNIMLQSTTITNVFNEEEYMPVFSSSTVQFEKNEVVNINSFIEYDPYHIAVHYPETDSPYINKELNKWATKLIKEFKSDVSKSKNKVKQSPELNVNFTIQKYKENIISFKFNIFTFINGENYTNQIQTKVFDLDSEKIFNFNDVIDFKKENIEELTKLVQNKIIESNALGDLYNYENLSEVIYPDKKNFENFIINENDIVFFYNRKQFSLEENSDGISIKIPIKTFVNTLKTDIKELGVVYVKNETIFIDKDGVEKPYRYIAITFDDGPHVQNTTYLLKELGSRNAKATFFLLGNRMRYNAELIQKIIDGGHEVGSHTFNHKELTKLSKTQINEQMKLTNNALLEAVSKKPTVFRPPYGSTNNEVLRLSKEYDMPIVLWNIDPQDWKYKNADTISKHIIQKVKNGDIILLHDIYKTSAEAAIIVVDELTKEGFKFLTVTELLSLQGEVHTGIPYRHSLIKLE